MAQKFKPLHCRSCGNEISKVPENMSVVAFCAPSCFAFGLLKVIMSIIVPGQESSPEKPIRVIIDFEESDHES